jgi:acyl-CoA synthetase (AMP-forming)/AMP-acid ligase II
LIGAADARAQELAEAGVGRGDRVVLIPANGLAFFVDLFAVWMRGAVAICAPPSLTANECEQVARFVEPRLWIGKAAPNGIPTLAPPGFDSYRGPPTSTAGLGSLDDPALILLTSGTTGKPKGVVHTQRSLQARMALNLAHIARADLATGLDVLPLHFGHGLIGNCLTVLAAGGRLVLQPDPGIDGLARLGDTIDRFDVTFLASVPALWRVVLKTSAPPSRGTLRRVHVGSAPLSAELWRAICDWCGIHRVLNMYGMTETANWIAGHSAEHGSLADGLVGRPWGGSIRVRTDDGAVVTCGRGELVVSTPSLMAGYLAESQATTALTGNWFNTGDVGEIDAHGHVRLLGRVRDDINRGGIKISCDEIDLLVERHPSVREACAFPIDDATAGEIIGVAVVMEEGHDLDAAGLRDWCSCNIRREALPDRFFPVRMLPQTDRGKRDRRRVRELCLQVANAGHTK